MQTILGAGGAIGVELARTLKQYTDKVRLVSRHPRTVNADDELMSADLTNGDDVLRAVDGSEVVYLTVGLPYDIKIWRATWPKMMRNVIDACKKHNSRLVFFDNVYMYDPDGLAPMTEATAVAPTSKKGAVRAQIAKMLLDEVESGQLQALIARSADFYGPSIRNSSILTEMVFNNFSNGKKAYWMESLKFKHSFTYTPDAGKASALLGNTEDAFNQVWHLPTTGNPPTGQEWIESIAKEMGVAPKVQVVSRFISRLMGLFVPVMREMVEMMYQYDRDYIFDSSKFERAFDLKPTPYAQGIKEVVAADYKSGPL